MTNLIIPPPHPLKGKRYDVLLIDPPWQMWGDPNKDAAAGKHYQLMTDTDVNNLSLKKILKKKILSYSFMKKTFYLLLLIFLRPNLIDDEIPSL